MLKQDSKQAKEIDVKFIKKVTPARAKAAESSKQAAIKAPGTAVLCIPARGD